MMIMTSLREATKPQHQAIERALDLPGRLITRTDYRQLLARFFGFYAPLEARLGAAPEWRDVEFDFESRRKTRLLVRDLRMLGLSEAEINALRCCRDLPVIESFGHALGCLYVLEGATLGGQIIARQVNATLGITPASGAAFYHGYGPLTGARWKEFGAFASACAINEEIATAMLAAAADTFAKLHQWLLNADFNPQGGNHGSDFLSRRTTD